MLCTLLVCNVCHLTVTRSRQQQMVETQDILGRCFIILGHPRLSRRAPRYNAKLSSCVCLPFLQTMLRSSPTQLVAGIIILGHQPAAILFWNMTEY